MWKFYKNNWAFVLTTVIVSASAEKSCCSWLEVG